MILLHTLLRNNQCKSEPNYTPISRRVITIDLQVLYAEDRQCQLIGFGELSFVLQIRVEKFA
jgi:hypothetical protein